MSVRYYVTPYDPVSWKQPDLPGQECDLQIALLNFLQSIRRAGFHIDVSPPFTWQIIKNGVSGISGSFFGHQNQILALEPDLEFISFLVWYRSFIPPQYDLFLFREGEWDSLKLQMNTSAQEIIDFTGIEY